MQKHPATCADRQDIASVKRAGRATLPRSRTPGLATVAPLKGFFQNTPRAEPIFTLPRFAGWSSLSEGRALPGEAPTLPNGKTRGRVKVKRTPAIFLKRTTNPGCRSDRVAGD